MAITDNVVSDYQKNGIVVNGEVSGTIDRNVVTGDGPITYIAQNGIQIGFGASGVIRDNEVSGNDYTPNSFSGVRPALLRGQWRQAEVERSFADEKNVCNFGRGGGSPSA